MNEGRELPAADSSDATRAAAAAWFARATSGDMTAADRQALAQWRAAHARHEAEYQALERLWQLAGRLPAADLRAMAAAAPEMLDPPLRSPTPRVVPPRRAAAVAVAAAFVGLGIGIAAFRWHEARPLYVDRLDAARGERRTLTLPDGSTVEANTMTSLEVEYRRELRTVRLVHGEASFDVAPDAARPFTVEAGPAQVRVTGTSFSVRYEGDSVRAVVAHGTVEVRGGAAGAVGGTEPLRLVAGQGTTVGADGTVAAARPVDIKALNAWREGRIVFDDTPLSDVLAEVARYRTRPIRLADPALGRLRLSSTFRIDDTDALLAALPLVLPVRVQQAADGGAEIAAR